MAEERRKLQSKPPTAYGKALVETIAMQIQYGAKFTEKDARELIEEWFDSPEAILGG